MKRHAATKKNAIIGAPTTVAGAETEKKINSTGELDLSRKSAETTKENKCHSAVISSTSTTLHRAAMEGKSDAVTKAPSTKGNVPLLCRTRIGRVYCGNRVICRPYDLL